MINLRTNSAKSLRFMFYEPIVDQDFFGGLYERPTEEL